MRDAVRDEMKSTDDARVGNSPMRHSYRVLGDAEKALMTAIKDKGGEMLTLLHQAGGTDVQGGRMASRELSIAQTKIEEAVMWAVKHVTA